MTTKHQPTPDHLRQAALRGAAERLLADAAAWGYLVTIVGRSALVEGERPTIVLTKVDEPLPTDGVKGLDRG